MKAWRLRYEIVDEEEGCKCYTLECKKLERCGVDVDIWVCRDKVDVVVTVRGVDVDLKVPSIRAALETSGYSIEEVEDVSEECKRVYATRPLEDKKLLRQIIDELVEALANSTKILPE